jgi:uncharacterized membrane protein YgcG
MARSGLRHCSEIADGLEAERAGNPALSRTSTVSKTTPAKRPGMPAPRTIIERAACPTRAAVPTGPTTLRNQCDIARSGFFDRIHRHRLGGHRHEAEANGERRCSKHFHRLSSPFAAMRQIRIYADNVTTWYLRNVISSNGGANSGGGASGGDASPNDGGASPSDGGADPSGGGASPNDVASAPLRASDVPPRPRW